MPWRGVTVSEQRQRFLEDYQLKYYSVIELADRFGISRTTAYTHPGHQGKWINRFEQHGQSGFHEHLVGRTAARGRRIKPPLKSW